ncbi:hypothetical protein [Methanobrevibacter olleyae]|uniref:SWIM-type domain-containing protein n=1 Tax=Methanobrevibacter olleyae TaxID=294671 RepID=A0A126R1M2_METOL|nr:hypothetical protein [Methanobrevibacter olleyae]AMK16290.1 hypothetical protein YLM1_1735 [Methanobrevibacter olleyae]
MITSIPIFQSKEYNDFLSYNDENHSEYLVTIDEEEGTVYCTCPHFQYRLQTEVFGGAKIDDTTHHCKHIKHALKIRRCFIDG